MGELFNICNCSPSFSTAPHIVHSLFPKKVWITRRCLLWRIFKAHFIRLLHLDNATTFEPLPKACDHNRQMLRSIMGLDYSLSATDQNLMSEWWNTIYFPIKKCMVFHHFDVMNCQILTNFTQRLWQNLNPGTRCCPHH